MNVAVIGAGPAGITAAHELAKDGVSVEVFESGPAVGGLARTVELWGQRVDLGPHRFFSADRRVNELWLEVVGRDYAMVDRLTRIYYGGRFFRYPLRPLDALRNLGLREAAACAGSYARERLRGLRGARPAETFEDWVVGRFGRRLFEIFFRSYSEKLWGIPCSELDADFAAQRIRQLSLWEAVKDGLLRGGGSGHRTLVDRFAYPIGGTGTVYERMAERVRRSGGQVHLRRPVERVIVEGGRATGILLASGEVRRFDHVVSTMPLTLLVGGLDAAPPAVRRAAEALRFRNTILVYLRVERSDLFADNWLYVHAPALKTGRITNFRNWHASLHGAETATILALEYWCGDDDPLWTGPDDALVTLARGELRATGLDRGAPVTGGHVVRVPRCYPVYRRGYKERVATIRAHLDTIPGLSTIGRYGSFKYNNQDHSILMGILAARMIARRETSEPWDVNADYETYQEASAITETGLTIARA